MSPLKKAFVVASLASLAGIALAQGTGMWGAGPMAPACGPEGMAGYGPGPYGPGPMSGHGYGPGMMHGPGGPGMMGFGYAMQSALDLSDDQRKKLDVINDDLQTKTWDIMGKMRVEMSKMRELMVADPLDKAALDATYKRMNDLRQERFDAHLSAHEQMAAVLTKEQREQLRHFGPWGLEPPG
ncbi:MAG TPA: Spy/CpxP family protein refolding chaperone [Casimicrobiaceae bacterium]